MHQRLEEGVVIAGAEPGRAAAGAERRVKLPRLVDKGEPLQLPQLHRHSLPAKQRYQSIEGDLYNSDLRHLKS